MMNSDGPDDLAFLLPDQQGSFRVLEPVLPRLGVIAQEGILPEGPDCLAIVGLVFAEV
jgi:hypothetical protein